jgi:hypothetical protein
LEALLISDSGCEVKVKSTPLLLNKLTVGDKVTLFVDVDLIGQIA